MKCLFEIKNGKATITDHTRTIWLYNDMIQKYGEDIAVKIFLVLHYMADLTLDNPFANIAEQEKLETILTNVCPELPLEIDWNSIELIEAVDFTRKIYETQSYRYYLANKVLVDKLNEALKYSIVDTSKESGNSGEIKKATELFSTLKDLGRKIYQDFLEENSTKTVWGKGMKSANKLNKGKSKELE